MNTKRRKKNAKHKNPKLQNAISTVIAKYSILIREYNFFFSSLGQM